MSGVDSDELVIARTPLRLSLGGGGTDLPYYAERYGADITTVAISLWVTVVARTGRLDGQFRFSYQQTDLAPAPVQVADPYVREALDITGTREPVEIVSLGPVPSGTGLGSSGAFTVSLLAALHELAGRRPEPAELAEQAFRLEAGRLGRPVGRQDHYACALGGLRRLLIDTDGSVATPDLSVAPETLTELGRNLHLYYTGQRRDSATALRPRTSSDAEERAARLHGIRALGNRMRTALETGAVADVAGILAEHWELKRSGESDPRWDRLMAAARAEGAQAGKVVGAGGGGFLLLFAAPRSEPAVTARLAADGLRHVPFDFVRSGTNVMTTEWEGA